MVNCNRTTVIRWLKRWNETTDLSDRKRIEKPRKPTAEQDEIAINAVRQDVDEDVTSQRVKKNKQKLMLLLLLRVQFGEGLIKLVLNIRSLSQNLFLLNIIKENVQYRPNH